MAEEHDSDRRLQAFRQQQAGVAVSEDGAPSAEEAQDQTEPTERPRYKTRWVAAPMMPLGTIKKEKIEIGTEKKPAGLFSKKMVDRPVYETKEVFEPNGKFSDVQVDQAALSKMIESSCNRLDEEGYDVISVLPVQEGGYGYNSHAMSLRTANASTGWGYGYGYSFTRGAIITGKRRDEV